MPDYKTYISKYIKNNKDVIVEGCLYTHEKLKKEFPDTNSTSSTNFSEYKAFNDHNGYQLYNFFQMSAPNIYIFNVYKELLKVINSFTGHNGLYIQSWINCQSQDQVLNWHRHEGFLYHGYICIDPKDTVTEFEDYVIENEVGLIYIGSGSPRHRVVNNSNYKGKRITLGFDLIEPSNNFVKSRSFIPIV
ncbi:MAG: hypothetical protein VX787_16125 [Pseudomonadota bacterium]|nr:hypothetical protein [Pseudomonadota bacterium]